jgi:hypothetical protein
VVTARAIELQDAVGFAAAAMGLLIETAGRTTAIAGSFLFICCRGFKHREGLSAKLAADVLCPPTTEPLF